jgi:hypothetical protein
MRKNKRLRMALEPTSSFPPVESLHPPRPSRLRRVVGFVLFALFVSAVLAFFTYRDAWLD